MMGSLAELIKDHTVLANLTGLFGGIAGIVSLYFNYRKNLRESPKINIHEDRKEPSHINLKDFFYGFDKTHYVASVNFTVQNAGRLNTTLIGAELRIKRLIDKDGSKIRYKKLDKKGLSFSLSEALDSGKFLNLRLKFEFDVPECHEEMNKIAKLDALLVLQFVDHSEVKLKLSAPNSSLHEVD
ncbi:hypothetical protein ACJVC5_03520 [Peredibacter sp. HCB2-198]|uniref:hypothetical protein n=1 Tax=Peredibacter sp. HCB2-198 TaxID=3383025 RepID=UPI0038B4A8D2